ncbi:MAG: sensor histidine kinase [Bacteroidetes bacterium]|nr:sensor histidine kinase [Bacteroidota bacterium]
MARFAKPFIFYHLAGIILFVCLPVIFFNGGRDDAGITNIVTNPWFWFFSLYFIAGFYFSAYFLFPQLYLQRQYFLYILAVLVLFVITYYLQPFDHLINGFRNFTPPASNKPPTGGRPFDIVSLFLCGMAIALGTIIPVVKLWQQTKEQFVVAQKDKANAELAVLKAQINPHFLFNTLNNLYALSLTGNEKTAESILRLSNIMRYVTDEVHNDEVLLQHEISCISDFIELQKLRLNSKTTVQFDGDQVNGHLSIAPLLLLPLVENVFKHGVSNNESSNINIKIGTRENEIIFYSGNRIFKTGEAGEREGTGIANVKKRLENVYPGKHFLQIETDKNIFEVHLIIHT